MNTLVINQGSGARDSARGGRISECELGPLESGRCFSHRPRHEEMFETARLVSSTMIAPDPVHT